MRKYFAAAAFGAFLYCAPGVAAVPQPHVPAPSHPHGPVSNVRNPHLHGANDPAAEKDAHRSWNDKNWQHDRDHWRDPHHFYFYTHHYWRHHWGYVSWVYLHRGLTTIHGFVHDADGRPVADATVSLRGQRGGLLRPGDRHQQHTGPGGNFAMHAVRSGTYRVRAQEGKAANYTMVHLHAGAVASVSVRI